MYRIAAVEDDELMQKTLESIVSLEGFEFVLYPDGGTALAHAAGDRPDLILLDMHLPDMSGHEICRRLKADARTSHVPVVMLTGEARELENRVKGLDAGAEDYLFKPVSPKVLMARIRSILKVAGKPAR
jgi:DNA-binding response OmpR family regulator